MCSDERERLLTMPAIFPGQVLLEVFMKQHDPPLSVVEVAKAVELSEECVLLIIRGQLGITNELAVHLGRIPTTNTDFGLGLQHTYDLQDADRRVSA